MGLRNVVIALLVCGISGAAQTPAPSFSTIYNFTGGNDGEGPNPIVVGLGGVLYGTMAGGGAYGYGTVFSLTPPASPGGAWTYTVIYSFGSGSDAQNPDSPLAIGGGGVLFGAASYGGTDGRGAIFQVAPPTGPGGQWTESVIYSFGLDVIGVKGGPTVGRDGVVYEVTANGGRWEGGMVVGLFPPSVAGGLWTRHVLYSFQGGTADGFRPVGNVVIGSDGRLYGATSEGGRWDNGTAFALAPPASNGGDESVLWSFTGYDGADPLTPVVIGANGVLYGTTSYGGGSGGGVAYSLTPTSSGSWRETVLYAFPYMGDLVSPGTLALGESGILYGAINLGGSSEAGTVFALEPPSSAGGVWTEVVLHTFSGPDGEEALGVAIGSGGVLYGTTFRGGINGYGTVFALTE